MKMNIANNIEKTANFSEINSAGANKIEEKNNIHKQNEIMKKMSIKLSNRVVSASEIKKKHFLIPRYNNKNNMVEEREKRGISLHLFDKKNDFPNSFREIPKNIIMDKEHLYEENLNYRTVINSLKEENIKLKTKILSLESENHKFQKILEDVEIYIYNKNNSQRSKSPNTESSLINGLKTQIKSQKKELDDINEINKKLKKTIKFTNIGEIEIELNAFKEENFRLKSYLLRDNEKQNQLKHKNDPIKKEDLPNTIISQLKQKTELMNFKIKSLEEENFNLLNYKETNEKKFEKQKIDLKQIKIQNQNQEKEINLLKGDIIILTNQLNELSMRKISNIEKEKEKEKEKKQTDQNENEIKTLEQSLKSLISQKDQVISYQEKTVGELRTKLEDKERHFVLEQKAVEKEMKKMRDEYEELEDKYKTLLNLHNLEERKRIENNSNEIKSSPLRPTSRTLMMTSKFNKENEDKDKNYYKRFKRVTAEEVQTIGNELILRMIDKKIDKDSIDQYLFPEHLLKNNKINIKNIKEVLEKEPFLVSSEKDSLLLSRYLIEDNNFEYVNLNFDLSNDKTVIRSIFRTLLGNYVLPDEKQEKRLRIKTQKFINKYGQSLKIFFKDYPKGATHLFMSSKQFKDGFKLKEIDVNEDVLNFMIRKLFYFTNDLGKLDKYKLFDIFPLNKQQIIVDDSFDEFSENEN